MRRSAAALAGLSTTVTAFAESVGGASAGGGLPKPADFTARVDNPWYPLTPGTVYVYRGVKDGKPARDVLTVTHRVKRIAGVPCVVVEDRLYLAGKLHERTTDWYTQDKRGNVWYFGEATAQLGQNGKVTSTEGSLAGGPGRRSPGHLHARARACRLPRPAGVVQGARRGPLLDREPPPRPFARARTCVDAMCC